MNQIILKIPFGDKDDAKKAASDNGARLLWQPDEKTWLFDGEPSLFPESLRQYRVGATPAPQKQERRTEESPRTLPTKPPALRPALTKRVLNIDYAYYALVRSLGAKYDKKEGVFYYDGGELPLPLTGFESKPFTREERIERIFNSIPFPARQDTGKFKPRPHQAVAVKEMIKAYDAGYPGFLLADDLGLGKTISGWTAVKQMSARMRSGARGKTRCKILIVSPLAVIPGWRDTILELGHADDDIIITNYQRLKKFTEMPEGRTAKSLKGQAHFAKAEQFDIVVLDESHQCKNITTATSKLAFKICQQAGFILWLSATAGQKVLELGYLASLLAARTGSTLTSINKDFEAWCKSQGLGVSRGAYGKWTEDGDTSSEKKVHDLLFKPDKNGVITAIRRIPSDIAGWPERQIILKRYDADPKELEAYKKEWEGFLQWMKSDKSLKSIADDERQGMGQLIRLRQKASMLKTAENVALTRELLDNGRQVAISCFFLDALDRIRELLSKEGIQCAAIHGSLSADEKERQRLLYQKEEVPVILFTPQEGINLQAGQHGITPRAQINHDIRWSGIQMRQIDGRSHRDGQFAPIYWTVLADTVEERVAELLISKTESMDKLNGDESSMSKLSDLLIQSGSL